MKKILTYILLATLLGGCINDPLIETGEDPIDAPAEGSVYVRLFLDLPSNGVSRAADGDVDRAQATNAENRIESLDVLVSDKATDKILDIFSLEKGNEALAGGNLDGGQIVVPLYARTNRELTIRIVVNAPESMRHNILLDHTSADIMLKARGKSYSEVINAFIPGTNGLQENLEKNGGCLPMTGIFATADGNKTIVFPDGANTTPETALEIHASLERMVAKMHVTAKFFKSNYLSDMYYVVARDPSVDTTPAPAPADGSGTSKFDEYDQTSPDWLGWVRIDNVLYIPNAVNKSTYLFTQPNGNTSADSRLSELRDPNMDLSVYGFGGQSVGSDGSDPWDDDFVHYSGVALQEEILSPQSEMSHAELDLTARRESTYDPTRYDGGNKPDQTVDESGNVDPTLPENNTAPYTRGMYCLENYFDKPSVDLSGSDEAIPMVTHLSITARLTPRWIVVKKDFLKLVEDYFKDADIGGLTDEEFLEKYNMPKSDVSEAERDLWTEMKKRYSECLTDEKHVYLNDYRIIATDKEVHAVAIINWSLKGNRLWTSRPDDFQDGRYPSGTFYAFKFTDDPNNTIAPSPLCKQQYLYLTAGVVASAKDENIALKLYSVPHISGWGYYYTYINGLGKPVSDPTAPMPYTASQVMRNTYYLITIDNFGTPGGSVNNPEFIKVNTDAVGWDYAGRGDVKLH